MGDASGGCNQWGSNKSPPSKGCNPLPASEDRLQQAEGAFHYWNA